MNRFNEFLNTTKLAVGTFVLLATTVISSFFYLDDRFAKANELIELRNRVDVNELQTLYKTALENLYFYRNQNRLYPKDMNVLKKLEEATEQVNDLKELLKVAKSKKLK